MKQITTNYVPAPKVRSQLDLLNIRKRNLIAQNDASVVQSYQKYLAPQERLEIKEQLRRDYFAAAKREKYGESRKSSAHQNMAEKNMAHIKENMKQYRGVNVGVHGRKLPGYSESENTEDKKYWQIAKDYVHTPENVSRLQLSQDNKWWAKNDKMLLSDLSPQQCSQIDSFKECHVPLPGQKELAEKVSRINHFSKSKSNTRGPK